MKEELLNLYCDYSNNDMIADKQYVINFLNIVYKNIDLSNYLKNIKFIPYNEDCASVLASYNFDEKKIYYYYKSIEKIIKKNYNFEQLIPKNEMVYYKNAIITTILLHELEHIIQYKNIFEKNNLESNILRISRFASELSNHKIADEANATYQKYYDFAPEERLAEIRSHDGMGKLISPIKYLVPNVGKIEEIFTVRNMLKGYKLKNELISPTVLYLQKQGKEKELEKFDWYDSSLKESTKKVKRMLDLDSRLELGLPIETSEYNHVQRRINKLVKHL